MLFVFTSHLTVSKVVKLVQMMNDMRPRVSDTYVFFSNSVVSTVGEWYYALNEGFVLMFKNWTAPISC